MRHLGRYRRAQRSRLGVCLHLRGVARELVVVTLAVPFARFAAGLSSALGLPSPAAGDEPHWYVDARSVALACVKRSWPLRAVAGFAVLTGLPHVRAHRSAACDPFDLAPLPCCATLRAILQPLDISFFCSSVCCCLPMRFTSSRRTRGCDGRLHVLHQLTRASCSCLSSSESFCLLRSRAAFRGQALELRLFSAIFCSVLAEVSPSFFF